jgi:hypothetical protein
MRSQPSLSAGTTHGRAELVCSRAPRSRRTPAWLVFALLALILGCEGTNQASVERALGHARRLVELATQDVVEVRQGLPKGSEELARLWADGDDLVGDPEAARQALHRARNKVQDLRVAKSTFFALATLEGVVIRNDQDQDLMAGRPLLSSFPALAGAARGQYVEALGVMPEAHGVKGKPDAEWVAAQGIRVGDALRGLYVTGWAWSSYALRLEFSLRGQIKSELMGTHQNVPLIYTFVLVGPEVYSAPEAPEVNARAIAERRPLEHLTPDGNFSGLIEITGRTFGLGVQLAPELGPKVAIGVLRSET